MRFVTTERTQACLQVVLKHLGLRWESQAKGVVHPYGWDLMKVTVGFGRGEGWECLRFGEFERFVGRLGGLARIEIVNGMDRSGHNVGIETQWPRANNRGAQQRGIPMPSTTSYAAI